MKQLHSWLAGVGAVVAVFTFVACQNDKEEDMQSYPTALVTVKPKALDNSFVLQLDDSTQLIPTKMKTSPYGSKEVRALGTIPWWKGLSLKKKMDA